jgi:hypothetical protein
MLPVSAADSASRELLAELQPGDGVRITHQVKVGQQTWTTTTTGRVVRLERRRHGLHFRRHGDDKVFSDIVVLERADGELTTVTLDEFTTLSRV